jgi:hypothetical protein
VRHGGGENLEWGMENDYPAFRQIFVCKRC